MDKIVRKADVPFKAAGGRTLGYDLYIPASLPPGGKAPLVVFVNGVGDRRSPR